MGHAKSIQYDPETETQEDAYRRARMKDTIENQCQQQQYLIEQVHRILCATSEYDSAWDSRETAENAEEMSEAINTAIALIEDAW